ncbi:AAA family ATPase [Actinospica durhamensis]|uniref:AAA family ATPase n=1 Tax=Actinospica durhamensis TaxID=1508375 RepID=A0A941EW33_9ACTN|nr:AAA family ATPase [Actinospica durhamensis]MBR7838358.1 AAA family ATPase [Actinospica durhamensis]
MTNPAFEHGMIIGKFYPPHAGHHFLVDSAASTCARVSVVVMASAVESIPLAARVGWLREAFADTHVDVVGIMDDLEIDYEDDGIWAGHVALMREALTTGRHAHVPVDAVFSSEPYGAELARRFDAAPVLLDPARAAVPISATKVRADPISHWGLIEPAVRAWLARRVVVVGAESTGTTTLSLGLAASLRARGDAHALTGWVPEYGRTLTVVKLAVARALAVREGRAEPSIFDLVWQDSDFLDVAERQSADEDHAARRGGPVLVCDTDALATTVWQERYRGAITAEVAAAATSMPPRALYILTGDEGVPFEDDGLRDGEHLRAWMTGRFREVLAAQGTPWIEVTGSREERLTRAVAAVDDLLARGWGLADPLG